MEPIPDVLTEFPSTFNLDGIIKKREEQKQLCHEEQSVLAEHLRGCIIAATTASVAHGNALVRFSFSACIELLKKGKHIPIYMRLEHDTIVGLVAELMTRFDGAVYAGRSVKMEQRWILLTDAVEFLPGDDCQICFFRAVAAE